jgi:hypothetical protein
MIFWQGCLITLFVVFVVHATICAMCLRYFPRDRYVDPLSLQAPRDPRATAPTKLGDSSFFTTITDTPVLPQLETMSDGMEMGLKKD